jgi:hypothetical protein
MGMKAGGKGEIKAGEKGEKAKREKGEKNISGTGLWPVKKLYGDIRPPTGQRPVPLVNSFPSCTWERRMPG